MDRSPANRLFAILVSAFACLSLLAVATLEGAQAPKSASVAPPKAYHPVKHGTSKPLGQIHSPSKPPSSAKHAIPNRARAFAGGTPGHDSVVQRQGGVNQPSPQTDFAGSSIADDNVTNLGGVSPASAVVDVGSGHVVQTVNSVLQVWSTSGTQELAPIATTSIFSSLGGQCGDDSHNAVDTVIRYDELAGRWVLAFVPYDFAFVSPFSVCVAVSTSSDPAGSWNTYSYDFDNLLTNPRLGVWPDGYYLAFDQLDSGFNFAGVETLAFDRAAMLDGNEAQAVGFSLPTVLSMVPADLDGSATPAEGTPNHQASPGQSAWDGSPSPVIHMFDFHADFVTPENSTFDGPFDVPVPDFNPLLCASGGGFNCIPELNGAPLNSTSGFLMNGMQYRNFGDHEAMVVSQTVNIAEGGDLGAVRWYEIRPAPTGVQGGVAPFSLFQSGTYSPSETNRFVPSIAMDVSGNIAMGYSVSDDIHPQIGYTGRLVGDPPGQMGSEAILIAGNGSQQSGFWGNYTGMVVDPTDGCTFWYTNQYLDADGDFNWLTRIGSFKFPSCTSGATGTLSGTVTDGANPLPGVKITAGGAQTTTDASGNYSFLLPVGTYDMTASKYGYFPGSASGVLVNDGETTTQNFELEAAPSTLINGTVKDSVTGWPLYAKIVVTASGFPGATFYTDPVTGYYETTLVVGIPYTFSITAVSQGYSAGGGIVDLSAVTHAPAVVKNWALEADTASCNAPGYSHTNAFYDDFSTGDLSYWTVVNNSGDGGQPWKAASGADPCGLFPGNDTGGSGPYALVNSNCDGTVTDDTDMISPSVNLSAVDNPVIQFASDFSVLDPGFPQTGGMDYSLDGVNWTNVLTLTDDDPGPSLKSFAIPALANQSAVQVRFTFDGFWSWWWQVDNVLVGDPTCAAGTGGMLVGNVKDAATNSALNGATVTNTGGGGSTKTFATPDDPNVDDGFYMLYVDSGNQSVEASMANFQSQQKSTLVVPGSAQRVDFSLLSGHLTAAPTPLNARVDPGGTDDQTLTLTNSGGAGANYEIVEINAPLAQNNSLGHFANKFMRQQALNRLPLNSKGTRELTARSSQGLSPIPNPHASDRVLAAGDVLASYPSNIAYGWGVATVGSNVWLSNLGVAGGDDLDYEYNGSDGALTGNTVDDSGAIEAWAADGAFDSQTGNFWRVNVVNAGSSCIFEVDPVNKVVTGNTICPNTGTSERGLAYDQATDTFYTGSWNDGTVKHFDIDGSILDSSFVALSISGLAFNSSNGHLLVMQNFPGGNDITVLDALNNYAVLGSYPILDNGAPAITAFGGAGAEFDCLGNLWVIDQNTQTIYQVESGESAGCEVDIPWFSVDPTEGTVAANGGTSDAAAHWEAGSLLPGLRQAQIQFKTDTPFTVPGIPVTMVVRFLDVPDDNQFQAFIYGAAGAGVMFGGTPVCSDNLHFCPDGVVTRADMAGYLWRAINGSLTPPPVYTNVFNDVTFNAYNSFYIQGIFDLGITAGCQASPPLYCPNTPVTRAQMSVFIWKGQHGEDPPPACSGVFADVPCPGGFAVDYIEGLAGENVTAGCGGGNFCPNDNITNGQMSVFLVKGFNIPHL